MTAFSRARCSHCREKRDSRPHRIVEGWIVLDNCAHAEWPGIAWAVIGQDGDLSIGPMSGSPYTAFVVPAAVLRKLMLRHRQEKSGKISGRVHAA